MSTITDNECTDHTLVDRITYWGQTDPETPAFIFWSLSGRRVFSRGDVIDLSSRFANRLTKFDVRPMDVVCVALPNSPERVVVEYGIHLVGAVSLNGQILRADGNDLIEALIKAKCSSIILDPDVTSGAWSILKNASESLFMKDDHGEYQSKTIPLLRRVIFCRASNEKYSFLESLSLDGKEGYILKGGRPQDIAAIFTTSGSTGYSKLVPHTHERIFMFGFAYCHMLKLQPACTFLNVSPLGWTGGFPVAFLFSGCTRIAIDESKGEIPDTAALLLEVIYKEKVNTALMLPSLIAAINEKRISTGSQGKHQLRKIFTSGQPIKKETMSVIGELTHSVANVYGAVEYALSCSISVSEHNTEDFEDYMIGYPFKGVPMKIVDGNLEAVSPTTRGEILVQSPALCGGYIGGDASTQESFLPGGWFRTGDIGYMREDGCFFAEGRSADAITHGGYILYPSWLEKKLINCPGVKDVIIVPVPDKLLHHEICACVMMDANAKVHLSYEDFISFSKQQLLLDKSSRLNVVPKYVLFFDVIPKTSNGKTDRKHLVSIARAQLNL